MVEETESTSCGFWRTNLTPVVWMVGGQEVGRSEGRSLGLGRKGETGNGQIDQ